MLDRVLAALRALLLRHRLEREMREELEQHLEQATARLMARGLSREEAADAARREFGVVERIREEGREARGGRWLDATWMDVRFGLRQFRRRPLSSATIVFVLALGIGANVALFAVLHSLATQPPPGMERDDALVRLRRIEVWQGRGLLSTRAVSFLEVQEYARHQHLFEAVTAWGGSDVVLEADGIADIEAGTAVYVTGDYFGVLGVRPVLGVGLPAVGDEASQSLVGVVSHALWDRLFGQAPDVLGRSVTVNGVGITVVGVAPPRFAGADDVGGPLEVWLPLAARAAVERTGTGALASYDSTLFSVAARLQPTVTPAEAQPAVEAVVLRAAGERRTRARPDREPTADVVPLRAANARPRDPVEVMLERAVLAGITTLVLLITCTTASTLLVGLAVARRREIAVRLSLGAGRRRVVRQLVTESTLLAVAAGALALLLTYALMRVAQTRFPDVPFAFSWPTVAFMLGLAVATGLLFGLSPALHGTRLAVAEVLKDTAAAVAGSRSWLQRGLVVAQIGLTQPMLVGLGAFILLAIGDLQGRAAPPLMDDIVSITFRAPAMARSLVIPPGDDAARAEASHAAARAALRLDMEGVRDRIVAMPGVRGVVPTASGYGIARVRIHPADRVPGSPEESLGLLRMDRAAPGYFDLLDSKIQAGRDFTPDDQRPDARVAIVGSDLARELWGWANPIGRRFVYDFEANEFPRNGGSPPTDSVALVVVGVVDAAAVGRSESAANVRVFTPLRDAFSSTLLVRTSGGGAAMIPAIRRAAAEVEPDLPVVEATTLGALERETQRFVQLATGAAAAGGLLALFLSAIGLYAVIAFAVGLRTREIGIRTALGASRYQVVGRFFAGGVRLGLLGLALGLPLSLVALRIFTATIGVRDARMPVLAALIAAVVMSVAAIATWIPARRAATVDPLIALRGE
jgi:predicted permease